MTHVRCAVYTRKSTEEGLEQEFNSLDAQREACEAFIRSQRGLGWMALATRYDDGGLSGGTMERPALQRLLADIDKRRVDLIVVYKVDRLTRSLTDFAKMVELFDARSVSFVSVTQQFNTSTSMGRLTLNVLLSFAQFEREVTGERIRDKIAASKKKGMWMGGLPPLGYDVRDKRLVINPDEADAVRILFDRYRELGTVRRLLVEVNRLGLVTKRREHRAGRTSGGQPFTRGHLYQLLANPLYAGHVAHKGVLYPGQHDAIIGQQTFDTVQKRLKENAAQRSTTSNAKSPSLLTGLVFDETGDRLCPTHANKRGRRYRYYISKRLMHRTGPTEGGWRLPAKALETAVVQTVGEFLRSEIRLVEALQLNGLPPDRLRRIFGRAVALADILGEHLENQPSMLDRLLHRVTLHPDSLSITFKRSGFGSMIANSDVAGLQDKSLIEISVPILLKRRGAEAKLIVQAGLVGSGPPNDKLIRLIAQARQWFDMLARGDCRSVREIAQREAIEESEVTRIVPFAFLAPNIVQVIIDGHQPAELTMGRLKRHGTLPLEWNRQELRLWLGA